MVFVVVGCLNAQSSFISIQSNRRWMDLLVLLISFLLRSFVCFLLIIAGRIECVFKIGGRRCLCHIHVNSIDQHVWVLLFAHWFHLINARDRRNKIEMMWRYLWRQRYCVERKFHKATKLNERRQKNSFFYRISAGFSSCLLYFVSFKLRLYIYLSFSLSFVVPWCAFVNTNISLLPNPH